MAGGVPCFRRFRLEDVETAKSEIEECRGKIAKCKDAAHQHKALAAHIRLGFLLTPLEQEEEAIRHLEEALEIARRTGDQMAEIEAILYLATAIQYHGDREKAQQLFSEGLKRAEGYEIAEFDSFFHHHRGRCCVEQGRLADARCAFELALALREQLGEPRFIMSTMGALEELDRMEGKC